MNKDLSIEISFNAAEFVAGIEGLAADLELVIREAREMAIESHDERCTCFRWDECPEWQPLAEAIDRIRPIVEKAKLIGR